MPGRLSLSSFTMARVAPSIPSETDLLCESCGYTLNGLPSDARCPECGTPVVESVKDGRRPSAWEQARGSASMMAFIKTFFDVLLRPTTFFRQLSVRGPIGRAYAFAWITLIVIAIAFAWNAVGHWMLVAGWRSNLFLIGNMGFSATIVLLPLLTSFAAKLTHWEASYRGLRLPLDTVRKCMYYHYVHYIPVALLIAVTTVLFLMANDNRISFIPRDQAGVLYLYTLAAEVVLAAGYLFWTYWIAMRNVMYANR
jgi:hypothetical protein